MKNSLAALLWVTLAGAAPALKVSLPTGSGTGSVTLATTGTGMARQADLRFFDGRAELPGHETVDLPGTWQRQGDAVLWTGGGATARIRLSAVGGLSLVTLDWTATTEVWVRAELQLPLAFGGAWSCFDGRAERVGQAGVVSQPQRIGTFPALAAWDATRGVGIGLDPTCWVSTFAPVIVSSDGRHGYLGFSVPLALGAGQTESVRWALGTFAAGPFGVRPLLEQWHQAFPAAYRPATNLDPRLAAGCAAGAVDYPPNPRYHPEGYDGRAVAAGAQSGWEWKYAKFKLGGDLVGRPDRWGLAQPEKASPQYRGSLEEFLDWRRANFRYTQDEAGVAPMFYWINWVSEELRERFADSLIAAADVSDGRGAAIRGWIHTYTTDHRAYPWNNTLGRQLQADAAELLEQLPLAGFATDVAVGGSRYRPAVWEPGRAYDRQGVWIDEGLGIARQMEAMHRLRASTGPYRAGVAANFYAGTHYAIAAAADTVIYEGSVYDALSAPQDAWRDRYLLGAKPRCWYVHLYSDDIGLRVPFEGVPAESLREILRARWDEAILWSFRFGWLPSPDLVYGYAPMVRALPLIQECVDAGWHPVSAMSSDQPLWLARYGTGLGTRLVVMNPHDTEARQAQVTVLTDYLGDGPLLFANVDGEPTTNRVVGQDVTLTVPLAPRSWQMFSAVGRHGGGPATVSVRTAPRFDPTAEPPGIGVVESHHAEMSPFQMTARYKPSQAFYEQAGVVRQELR